MDYDVLILGGGIIGCATAYELSKYSLNIALIEKEYDIAYDVALINTEVVYDGIECDNSINSKLEIMGSRMFQEITSKFQVPYKKCPSLMVAKTEKDAVILEKGFERAIKRGIDDVKLLSKEEALKIEPNLAPDIKKVLYTKNTGVVCPYDLAIAYGEVAFDNGVNFKLEEEVLDIQKISRGFRVVTNKNKFTCKMVINTTSGKNYSFDSHGNVENVDIKEDSYYIGQKTSLQYFLVNKNYNKRMKNITYFLNSGGNEVFSVPTVQGNLITAVKSNDVINYDNVLKAVRSIFEGVGVNNINTFYQIPFYNGNMIIDDSFIDRGYIRVGGKHYGEVAMTPAIASIICQTVADNMQCKPKKEFVDRRREYYRFSELSNEERNRIIKLDKRYGKMICMCQKITEGEIVDAIRRPLGARTLEGIKRRTGVTQGNCQGSYCMNKIVEILARETNKNYLDIVRDTKNSNIVRSRIKEFDDV